MLVAITLAGLWLRVDNLGLRSLSADEGLHVLAARALLERGEPRLPSGEPYTRSLPVTQAVAAAFARWGESEAAARAPSVAAGVLAIPAAYLLGASLFGRAAGLLAAFLLAFSPDAVAMSRFARMYAPMQLLVILATWSTFRGMAGGETTTAGRAARQAAWLGAGGALLVLAGRLHAGVYLLLPSIGLYALVMTGMAALRGGRRAAFGSPCAVALAAGLATAALVLLVAGDEVAGAVRRGMARLPWFPADAWDPKFYHLYLTDTYGSLWLLTPAAVVALLVTRPRSGLYAALLFFAPFVCLSAAVPTQSPRYLFVFLPFLFLLLGEAGRLAGTLLFGRLSERLGALLPSQRLVRPLAALAFVGTLAAVVRASPWFAAAQANRLKPAGEFAGASYAQWREAAAYVAREGRQGDIVIGDVDHLILYYFERVDGRLLYRNQGPHPRDRSPRLGPAGWRFRSYTTGVPAFSDAEALAAVVASRPRGWLVLERRRLTSHPSPLAPGVRAFIGRHLTEEETPADASIAVFSWNTPTSARSAGLRSR